MKRPAEQWAIQIDVTNLCGRACSNCTRLTAHVTKPYEIDTKTYAEAVASVADWVTDSIPDTYGRKKVIGMIGGEPTTHRQFPTLCRILADTIPDRDARGLWTRGGTGYTRHRGLIEDTFGYMNFNDHSEECLHTPVLVAAADVIEDPAEMWEKLDACWLPDQWAGAITPRGFFFCEVAAALDTVLGGPGGLPVGAGVWDLPLEDFEYQRRHYCPQCGVALKLPRRHDTDRVDDVSASNLEALQAIGSPRIQNGRYALMDKTTLESGAGDTGHASRYLIGRYKRERVDGKGVSRVGGADLRGSIPPDGYVFRGSNRMKDRLEGPKAAEYDMPAAPENLGGLRPVDSPKIPSTDVSLSVCILSIAKRHENLAELLAALSVQVEMATQHVEILIDIDSGQTAEAEKRTGLLQKARGWYVCFIDDDDEISDDYVAEILAAMERNPGVDCITFEGIRTVDGGEPRPMIWRNDIPENMRMPDGARHIRANHITPIRRDLAQQAFFYADLPYGADQCYALLLHHAGLLKTEEHICKPLYHYRWSPNGTVTQRLEHQTETHNRGIDYRPYRIRVAPPSTDLHAGDLVIERARYADGMVAVLAKTWATYLVSAEFLEALPVMELAIGTRPRRPDGKAMGNQIARAASPRARRQGSG